jgi:DUF177 domain-containing protein
MSPLRTDTFDLGGLRLTAGEGRRLGLHVPIGTFSLGGESYPVQPEAVPVRLDISRTTGDGYALRLRFEATLAGPCMRCLEPASPSFTVDAREVSQPGVAGVARQHGHAHGSGRGRHGSPGGRSPGGRLPGGRSPGGRSQEEESDDLTSPYVQDGVLDLQGWARDALALSLPANLVCRDDCAGLCPVCGTNLNDAGAEHGHEREPDPRWAALSQLRFE